jgi:hypothetical protein
MSTTNVFRGFASPCSPCSSSPSVCSIRCVQGNFIPTDDVPASYDFTNMLAWVNGFDLTTLAWNTQWAGVFYSAASTVPDSAAFGGQYTPGPVNTLWDVGTSGEACGWVGRTSQNPTIGFGPDSAPTCQRCQYLLPTPTAYYVVAEAYLMGGSPPSCTAELYGIQLGCTYAQQTSGDYPMIVEVGVPADPSGSIYLPFYFLGLITSGAAVTGPGNCVPIPSLAAEVPSIISPALGIWNASATCFASPKDPFTGDDPP